MISFHKYKAGIFLIAALSLSGCASILPEPAPSKTVYRLSASSSANAIPAAPNAIVMRVDRPTVTRPLAGYKIAVSPAENRILAADGAIWAENVSDLIQGSIMDVFASRGNIIGVLPVSGARTELRLHLNVRNFEASYDQGEGNAPLAVVRYTATVVNASDRDLIGTYDVRKTFRADDNRVAEIVKALDMANASAIHEITDWLESTMSQRASS